MFTPKIVVIPGSTRSGSVNVKLAGIVVKALMEKGAEVTWLSLSDYDMPIYNGDLEAAEGVPENAKKLARLIEQHHGVVLVSPEYNGSISPLLKNTLDWMSRDVGDAKPYDEPVYALAGCTPSVLGTARGIRHLRDILVSLGAEVISAQLTVNQSGSAFDENEKLASERHSKAMDKMCDRLVERATFMARD